MAAARTRRLPDAPSPQLATLVRAPPLGDAWVHEPKLDGYRILARLEGGRATLLSRRGNDWTSRMPTLAHELEGLGLDGAVLDGEVCALDASGKSDFQLLQNALGTDAERRLVDYVFDALFLDGEDLRPLPLVERKARLREALGARARRPGARVRYTEHVVGRGDAFFAEACRLGLEGMIAKRADRPYRAGRSPDWLKVKCTGRQELVVGGFTAPGGSRAHLGALLVGVRDGERLVYAGKVGTGFTERSLADLERRLRPLRRDDPPFADPPRGADARGVTWVEPRLVAEIELTEMTRGGRLRHPVFRGLRLDKAAAEVVRERPAPQRRRRSVTS
jgi:bifunctional non-homologous end joining protein LigD